MRKSAVRDRTRPGGPQASQRAGRVVGIDAAGKHGWVGSSSTPRASRPLGSEHSERSSAGPNLWMPSGGHPHRARRGRKPSRRCFLARRFVGPRASSVFSAPPAEVHQATSYAEANEMLVAFGRPKLSRRRGRLFPRSSKPPTSPVPTPASSKSIPRCPSASSPAAWRGRRSPGTDSCSGVDFWRTLASCCRTSCPKPVEPSPTTSSMLRLPRGQRVGSRTAPRSAFRILPKRPAVEGWRSGADREACNGPIAWRPLLTDFKRTARHRPVSQHWPERRFAKPRLERVEKSARALMNRPGSSRTIGGFPYVPARAALIGEHRPPRVGS